MSEPWAWCRTHGCPMATITACWRGRSEGTHRECLVGDAADLIEPVLDRVHQEMLHGRMRLDDAVLEVVAALEGSCTGKAQETEPNNKEGGR